MTEPIMPAAADQRYRWSERLEEAGGAGGRAAVMRRLQDAKGGWGHLSCELVLDARADVAREDDRDLAEAQFDHD